MTDLSHKYLPLYIYLILKVFLQEIVTDRNYLLGFFFL